MNSSTSNIYTYEFFSNSNSPKGIIHISHGMAEHILRYSWLIDRFNRDGYHVIAQDHRGHGKKILNESEGFFSEVNGWGKVISDLEILLQDTKTKYPHLKQYLLGHSMGAWICLKILINKNKIDGLILSGATLIPSYLVILLNLVSGISNYLYGGHAKNNFLYYLTFETYNKAFKPNRTKSDWISSDNTNVNDYLNDPLCGFRATNNLWLNLSQGISETFNKNNYLNVYKDTPIYIISGKDDPFTDFGKGTKKLFNFLCKFFNNISIKIVNDARHEVFSETSKEKSYNDVLNFLSKLK